jgi:hypothetical protein
VREISNAEHVILDTGEGAIDDHFNLTLGIEKGKWRCDFSQTMENGNIAAYHYWVETIRLDADMISEFMVIVLGDEISSFYGNKPSLSKTQDYLYL